VSSVVKSSSPSVVKFFPFSRFTHGHTFFPSVFLRDLRGKSSFPSVVKFFSFSRFTHGHTFFPSVVNSSCHKNSYHGVTRSTTELHREKVKWILSLSSFFKFLYYSLLSCLRIAPSVFLRVLRGKSSFPSVVKPSSPSVVKFFSFSRFTHGHTFFPSVFLRVLRGKSSFPSVVKFFSFSRFTHGHTFFPSVFLRDLRGKSSFPSVVKFLRGKSSFFKSLLVQKPLPSHYVFADSRPLGDFMVRRGLSISY
jgi:hypothetical protein